MRQASAVSDPFSETIDFGTIFSSGNDFPCIAQSLILIVRFLQHCPTEFDLEHGINGNDGVIPDNRPALPDQQFDQRNPRSNWTQYVANIQKSETCLRMPKLKTIAK